MHRKATLYDYIAVTSARENEHNFYFPKLLFMEHEGKVINDKTSRFSVDQNMRCLFDRYFYRAGQRLTVKFWPEVIPTAGNMENLNVKINYTRDLVSVERETGGDVYVMEKELTIDINKEGNSIKFDRWKGAELSFELPQDMASREATIVYTIDKYRKEMTFHVYSEKEKHISIAPHDNLYSSLLSFTPSQGFYRVGDTAEINLKNNNSKTSHILLFVGNRADKETYEYISLNPGESYVIKREIDSSFFPCLALEAISVSDGKTISKCLQVPIYPALDKNQLNIDITKVDRHTTKTGENIILEALVSSFEGTVIEKGSVNLAVLPSDGKTEPIYDYGNFTIEKNELINAYPVSLLSSTFINPFFEEKTEIPILDAIKSQFSYFYSDNSPIFPADVSEESSRPIYFNTDLVTGKDGRIRIEIPLKKINSSHLRIKLHAQSMNGKHGMISLQLPVKKHESECPYNDK